jgi:iron-sulfur cluster repair protein YtfE (RIC family)
MPMSATHSGELGSYDARATGVVTQDAACDRLIQHLKRDYQRVLNVDLPGIEYLLDRFADDGCVAPDFLVALRQTFSRLRYELEKHGSNEENILFPVIAESDHAAKRRHPITMMQRDLEIQEQLLARMRNLLHEDTPGAGDVFRAWQGLDSRLQAHIRLERNILFPLALQLVC